MYKVSLAAVNVPEETYPMMFDALQAGKIGQSEYIAEFENAVAKYVGANHCIAVSNGTMADAVAVAALKATGRIKPVVVPALTFIAQPNSVRYNGLPIEFADIKEDWTMDLRNVPEDWIIFGTDLMGRLMINRTDIEDACFAKGTQIKTIRGDKGIEDIKEGDLVLTRNGYERVTRSWKTGTKKVIRKLGITATPDHPFITKLGSKRLDVLNVSDIIYVWNEKRLCIEERHISDIQNPFFELKGYIFTRTQKTIQKVFRAPFMFRYGLTILGKYLMDFMSTIKTRIPLIMTYPILSYSTLPSTLQDTLMIPERLKNCSKTLSWQELEQQNGTEILHSKTLELRAERKVGKKENRLLRFVIIAKKNTKHFIQISLNFVAGIVKARVDTYNLTVESTHEFFANNVLVHNCESFGTSFYGQRAGTLGTLGTFSFFPSHTISTGEGGAIVTDDPELANLCRSIRAHGSVSSDPMNKFHFPNFGFNARMCSLQAVLGIALMKHIDEYVSKRRENFLLMKAALGGFDERPGEEVVPHGYPIEFASEEARDVAMRNILEASIECRKFFSCIPMEEQQYKSFRYLGEGHFPVASHVAHTHLYVPCHQNLSKIDVYWVIDTVLNQKGIVKKSGQPKWQPWTKQKEAQV